MNNYEKYKEQIDAMWKEDLVIALVDGKPTDCKTIHCSECNFSLGECESQIALMKWLVSKYEKPKVDWESVAVDTPILVSDNGEDWSRRYFAKYEDGLVYTWVCGTTSWSSLGCATCWDYAKLAEVQNER